MSRLHSVTLETEANRQRDREGKKSKEREKRRDGKGLEGRKRRRKSNVLKS